MLEGEEEEDEEECGRVILWWVSGFYQLVVMVVGLNRSYTVAYTH